MTTRCRSRESRRHGSISRAATALALGLLFGCSATSIEKPGGAGASSTGGSGAAAGPSFGGDLMMSNVGPRCKDGDESLKCKVMDCPADSSPSTTTVSGKVYDPAGRVPLYNAVVYVAEKKDLKQLGQRVKCESCSEHFPKTAMAVALTGSDGSFRLTDVPAGKDVPLVIQLGKWRRFVTLDYVAPCTDNRLDADKTRLPRNSTEGDLPKIAVTTGGSDALECLLKKIGVDESEFTPDGGPGRVNLFSGYRASKTINVAGASQPLSTAEELWASSDRMLDYDMILMGCEGAGSLWKPPEEVTETNPVPLPRPVAMQLEVRKYADLGGRIFGSHWHHRWINSDDTTPANPYPPSGLALASFSQSSQGFKDELKKSLLVEVDATFPKGIAFRDWLVNVNASTVPGQLSVKEAEHSVDSINAGLARRWIYGTDPLGVPDTSRVPEMVQYFSFTAPVGAAEECGRMVFSDLHVSIGGGDGAATPFPNRCGTSTELSPQEKALEFMIFDLSSCIQKEDDEIKIPIVK